MDNVTGGVTVYGNVFSFAGLSVVSTDVSY